MCIRDRAREAYLLADHTKLGKSSSFISCPIEEIRYLITDEKASPEIVEELRSRGVMVHQVRKTDFLD